MADCSTDDGLVCFVGIRISNSKRPWERVQIREKQIGYVA